MKFSARFVALLPVFTLFPGPASGQSQPKRAIATARLESVALGSFEIPKWYFMKADESGRKWIPAPLETSVESRGTINLVPVSDGQRIVLFSSPECDPASKILEIPVDPGSSSLLQFFYLDPAGHVQSKVVQEAKDHGSGQIRVINLLGVPGGVSAEKSSLLVKPGEDKVLPLKLPASKFFTYQAGWETSGGALRKTGEMNLFFPSPALRMTVVLSTVPSQREISVGEFETIFGPQDYRFYDQPQKEPPTSPQP